jgi:hypothetical protein
MADRRAFHADHARAFERAALVGAQAIDVLFDQLPHVFGNARVDLRVLALQDPLAVRSTSMRFARRYSTRFTMNSGLPSVRR